MTGLEPVPATLRPPIRYTLPGAGADHSTVARTISLINSLLGAKVKEA